MRIALAHGWGCDATLWRQVRRLAPAQFDFHLIDFGYYGDPVLPDKAQPPFDLAVGHSLGALWWLTEAPAAWRRLLCINGFARFSAAPDYPGVAPRLIARMRKQLAQRPATVLQDFFDRCAAPASWRNAMLAATPAPARLDAGLALLAEGDGRALLQQRRDDIYALASEHDAITPAAMSRAAFAALAPQRLHFSAAPGHLTPLGDARRCVDLICAVVA